MLLVAPSKGAHDSADEGVLGQVSSTARWFVGIALLSLISCGSDGPRANVTPGETKAPAVTEKSEPKTSPTVKADDTAPQQPHIFRTPDGNIGCYMGYEEYASTDTVRCDIRDRDWEFTADMRPSDCPKEYDWGQGIEIFGGRARIVCATDTALGSVNVLNRGQEIEFGSLVCEGLGKAIRCEDNDTDHGFFLGPTRYEMF